MEGGFIGWGGGGLWVWWFYVGGVVLWGWWVY